MKRVLAFIVCCLVCVGVAQAVVQRNIPKDPPKVYVPFVRTPCPKEFTVTECNWWERYQEIEEARWNELIRQINRGHQMTFESIRSVADSVGRIP